MAPDTVNKIIIATNIRSLVLLILLNRYMPTRNVKQRIGMEVWSWPALNDIVPIPFSSGPVVNNLIIPSINWRVNSEYKYFNMNLILSSLILQFATVKKKIYPVKKPLKYVKELKLKASLYKDDNIKAIIININS